jgi:hypothetical protein
MPTVEDQIRNVTNFQDLIETKLYGEVNAVCWNRKLSGDFSEIVQKIETEENILIIDEEKLKSLQLSDAGQVAREILIDDLKTLREFGASPILNLIKCYDRDDELPFFATDVYSFHVDHAPIPTDTYLCTYFGESSEILPNAQAEKKVLIPKIRQELRKLYDGTDDGFETFLSEYFFDLHYEAKPNAIPINLGIGNLWRLSCEYPESEVIPCIHRAPKEKHGECRLLMIC